VNRLLKRLSQIASPSLAWVAALVFAVGQRFPAVRGRGRGRAYAPRVFHRLDNHAGGMGRRHRVPAAGEQPARSVVANPLTHGFGVVVLALASPWSREY
jgi:hypothetical protein